MEYARAQGYPVPEVHELRSNDTEIVMERIAGPLMSDAILQAHLDVAERGEHARRPSRPAAHDPGARVAAPDARTAAARSSISICIR